MGRNRAGWDADANARYRAKRRARHADTPTVPGARAWEIQPTGTHKRPKESKRARRILAAWDNRGGTGEKVEWVHGFTCLRTMAPSAKLYDGPCPDVGAPGAGENRPERWTDHGRQVDGTWKAGRYARTEARAFAIEIATWKRD